jgi:hypothetical protein
MANKLQQKRYNFAKCLGAADLCEEIKKSQIFTEEQNKVISYLYFQYVKSYGNNLTSDFLNKYKI